MKENTNGHDYEIFEVERKQKGISTLTLVNILAFILLFLALGFAYLAIQDRINGLDAYRFKALKDQIEGYKTNCEQNRDSAENLKEWIRQNNLKPPASYMLQRQCSELPSPEKKEAAEH